MMYQTMLEDAQDDNSRLRETIDANEEAVLKLEDEIKKKKQDAKADKKELERL